MLEIMGGIALSAFLFAALLWSIYRAAVTSGKLRINATFLTIYTLLGMVALTYSWVVMAQVTGVLIIITALVAIWTDPGWSKLLPVVQALFGVVLIVGLPWLTA